MIRPPPGSPTRGPATRQTRAFRTPTSIVVSSPPVSVTPRRPRSPASSANIRKPASSSRPASTWGQISLARQSPVVQSVWMFFTNLFAAAVPVVPFALFTLATARLVSLSVTLVLLVLLGVGCSMIGRRRLLPTVAETIGIAVAAAFAGLAIGKLIS